MRDRRTGSGGDAGAAVKKGWPSKKLSDVCEIVMGTSPPGDTYNTTGEGMPLVNGPVEFSPGPFGKTVQTKFTTAPNKLCKENDLILCVRGSTTGKMNIAGFEACIGRGVAAIRAKEYQPWINYFVRSKRDDIYSLGTGATFPNISTANLANLKILVPPLPEQQRIVGILDEAFDGIATAKANAEKNLRNARELFESEREEVLNCGGVGWKEQPLAQLCTIKHGFAFKSEFFTESGEHVLLTPGNFFETGGYRDRGDKQKYYEGDIPDGFILKNGDLLVAMTEQAAGLLGSPILVPESNRFLHNQRLGLVEAKPGVTWANEFFFHVFNLKHVRDELHHTGTGLKVRHTSPTKIGDVVVSFPASVAEQKKIATRLVDVNVQSKRLEALYQQKLAALDELKKSLLHRAFSGEL